MNWAIAADYSENKLTELLQQFDVSQTLAKLALNRGVSLEGFGDYLSKSLRNLQDPSQLYGASEAAERLAKAVLSKEKILIHGDFDADGITSCALVFQFLKDMGAEVGYFIPNRLTNNHGLALEALDIAKSQDISLVMTTDCGSSDAENIRSYNQSGIDVIISDHHHPGDTAQASCVFVNPHMSENRSQWEQLTGVGVAFAVVVLLRQRLREANYFDTQAIEEPNLKTYLDIVALGTVADMGPLTGQNRILVAHGLEVLSRSERLGIQALRELSGIEVQKQLSAEDIGFRLAPRINASARLGYSEDALKLLTADNTEDAYAFARSLEGYNTERKALLEMMFARSLAWAKIQEQSNRRMICVGDESFHPGLIGLVAQKLAQQFSRPCFVYTAHQGEHYRCSGRSSRGISLNNIFAACDGFLSSYGGHDEAGGCVFKKEQLKAFMEQGETYLATLKEQGPVEKQIDDEILIDDLSFDFYHELQKLSPFGIGNERPLFCSEAKVIEKREVGANHLKLKLTGERSAYEAIGFSLWDRCQALCSGKVWVVYHLGINHWQGEQSLQLELKDVLAEKPKRRSGP